jgi:hypothetical protein
MKTLCDISAEIFGFGVALDGVNPALASAKPAELLDVVSALDELETNVAIARRALSHEIETRIQAGKADKSAFAECLSMSLAPNRLIEADRRFRRRLLKNISS